MRILIVEDESTSQLVLAKQLAPYGSTSVASSGAEGYDQFIRAHGAFEPFDLITVDVDIPIIQGTELVRKIRQWEDRYRCYDLGCCAKILMVTSDDRAKVVLASFRHGAEGYLFKPVRTLELRESLEKMGIVSAAAA